MEDLKEKDKEAENPYFHNIAACDELIAYLHKMRIQLGQVHIESENEHIKAEMLVQKTQVGEALQKKIKDGQLQTAKSKKEREEEEALELGNKGKKSRAQKKAEKASKHPESHSHNFSVEFEAIHKFGQIKVSPPGGPEDLEKKIEELKKVKAEYEAKGKAEMEKEEELPEEELRRQAEKIYHDRERMYDDDDQYSRPHRGGRGRGFGRGGRRFDDDREAEKSPRESDADERKDRKKKVATFKMDEESFPDLE